MFIEERITHSIAGVRLCRGGDGHGEGCGVRYVEK